MSRPVTARSSRAATAALVLVVGALLPPPKAFAADPALESTGRIDLSIEPPMPTVAVPLVIGPDEKPVLVDGKATPTSYQLFTFKPPADRMFELRLFAPEGNVAMTIFRGAATTPEPGAGPADRAIMWMSSSNESVELRILVRGRVAGETPFKLGAKLYPKSNAAD
jgi:hypothetical protein